MKGLQRLLATFIPILFLFLLTSFALQAEEKAGFYHGSIDVQNKERTFTYYIPSSYNHDDTVPLLLAFHGRGSTGKNQINLTKFDKLAEKEGFIAVFPDSSVVHEPNLKKGHERQWNDGRVDTPAYRANVDDIQFISKLIDHFTEHYNVDRSRVYAVGMSNGAFFVNRLAIEMPERIAGIGAVAGTIAVPITTAKPSEPVSTVFIMGTDDPIVPYHGVKNYSLSAEEAVHFWRQANGIKTKPTVKHLPKKAPNDKTEVSRFTYTHPSNHTEVSFYKVKGGGHTWPGGPQYAHVNKIGYTSQHFNATETLWHTLKKNRKDSKA